MTSGAALTALLLFCRILVFLALIAPLRRHAGGSGLAAAAIALAAWLFEPASGAAVAPAQHWLLLVLRECLLGALLALPFVLALEAGGVVGALLDLLRGAQLAEQLALSNGERASPGAALLDLAAPTLCLVWGGGEVAAGILRSSVLLLPLGAFALPAAFDALTARYLAPLLAVPIVIVAPWAVLTVLLELLCGVLGRLWGRGAPGQELSGAKAWLLLAIGGVSLCYGWRPLAEVYVAAAQWARGMCDGG